jgi:DNA repair exonuclease SbcCD nuclease subunit
LPPGFECYVSGHIHWREKTELRGSPFIIPGSLIPTQLKKKESEIEKGFFVVDTQKKEIDFEEVDPPRMFFYEEIENEEGSIREIENLVGDRLEEIFSDSFESKPLVRLKIKGKMPGGVSTNDLDLSQVKNKYSDRGIISISKDLEEEGVDKKIQMLRDVRNEELSVEEIGMKTLREEMEETGSRMDPDMIFDDLVQGNIENVMNRLLEGDETGYDPEEEGSVEETAEEESGSEEEERHGEKEWWRKASNKT